MATPKKPDDKFFENLKEWVRWSTDNKKIKPEITRESLDQGGRIIIKFPSGTITPTDDQLNLLRKKVENIEGVTVSTTDINVTINPDAETINDVKVLMEKAGILKKKIPDPKDLAKTIAMKRTGQYGEPTEQSERMSRYSGDVSSSVSGRHSAPLPEHGDKKENPKGPRRGSS